MWGRKERPGGPQISEAVISETFFEGEDFAGKTCVTTLTPDQLAEQVPLLGKA
jgi:hypothetical protein